MNDITEQDILVRLQLTSCKIGTLSNTYVNNLKWGRKEAKISWKELILLDVYLKLIEKYDLTSDNNCITEDELTSLFDKISTLTKLCFKPYGFSYKE